MSVELVHKDPWELFIGSLLDSVKEGLTVKVSLDGFGTELTLDEKALRKLVDLFKKGVPLEVALGIDLPKILSQIAGEKLSMDVETRDSKIHLDLSGDVLESFREAMKANPIDGEVMLMLGRILERVFSE